MTRDDAPSGGSLTFDPEEGAYVTEFDRRDVSPAVLVTSVIAELTGQSETELRPLYQVIDPDALNRFLGYHSSRVHHNRRFVEFIYQNYTVRVLSSGILRVYPPSARGDGGGNDDMRL